MDEKLVEWLASVFPDNQEVVSELQNTLSDNPGRISRAFRFILGGYLTNPQSVVKVTLELPEQNHAGLVSSNQIPFLAICAHHFLPFFGTIDIIYEPGPYIIGIGKMPRIVDCRARRFQLQEILVKDICTDMSIFAKAKGVYVRSVARHLCVCYRGPRMFPTINVSTYSMGTLADPMRMPEILSLLAISSTST